MTTFLPRARKPSAISNARVPAGVNAVDGNQVRRGIEVGDLPAVIVHEFDFNVRRRERGEDGDASDGGVVKLPRK